MTDFTSHDFLELARKRVDSCRETALRAGIRGKLDTSIIYLSSSEVASRLSVTTAELHRLVADGEIMAERWGSTLLFHPDEMRRHAEEF